MKLWIAAVFSVLAVVPAVAADQAVVDRYNKSCSLCHAAGAAGAPRTYAAEEWKVRLAKGMDTLVASVENGFKAMPPKGMCFDCSHDDFVALINYMAAPAE